MSKDNIRVSIEQRAQRAIIQHAFLRWESALVIAGAILLSVFLPQPFPWWPWWGWLALGLIAEGLIVYTSVADVDTAAAVVADIFREQFDPRQVGDKALRGKLTQAACEALTQPQIDIAGMRDEYRRRRNFIHARFNEMGLPCHRPRGAFYAFPYIGGTGLTSREFAMRLLDEEKVAAVPGSAFGSSGEGFLRCAYATAMDDLETAMDRLEAMLRRL